MPSVLRAGVQGCRASGAVARHPARPARLPRRWPRHSALGLGCTFAAEVRHGRPRQARWTAPPLTALARDPSPQPPRRSSSDPKELLNIHRHLSLGVASGPPDRLAPEHQGPSGRCPRRAVCERGAPGPEVPVPAALSVPVARARCPAPGGSGSLAGAAVCSGGRRGARGTAAP